ncbi:hypothetical protein I79_012065 [Cricetulus griseus]|uniref:Uncharacterized protein n=1 Tax=Cricetulus griseus TaxID=10029 RepID=G3HMU9_CRIGR|nr:hypothetical protein I79_012065 [Cricetulus griseus]
MVWSKQEAWVCHHLPLSFYVQPNVCSYHLLPSCATLSYDSVFFVLSGLSDLEDAMSLST